MFLQTVVDALADHTARLLAADATALAAWAPAAAHGSAQRTQWHVREVMRMITNAWCLAYSMHTFDEWTLLQVQQRAGSV